GMVGSAGALHTRFDVQLAAPSAGPTRSIFRDVGIELPTLPLEKVTLASATLPAASCVNSAVRSAGLRRGKLWPHCEMAFLCARANCALSAANCRVSAETWRSAASTVWRDTETFAANRPRARS